MTHLPIATPLPRPAVACLFLLQAVAACGGPPGTSDMSVEAGANFGSSYCTTAACAGVPCTPNCVFALPAAGACPTMLPATVAIAAAARCPGFCGGDGLNLPGRPTYGFTEGCLRFRSEVTKCNHECLPWSDPDCLDWTPDAPYRNGGAGICDVGDGHFCARGPVEDMSPPCVYGDQAMPSDLTSPADAVVPHDAGEPPDLVTPSDHAAPADRILLSDALRDARGATVCSLGTDPLPCNNDAVCTSSGATCDSAHSYCVCATPNCTPGQDQTCNDNPALNSFHGHCTPFGSCLCQNGFMKNPQTGKCL